MVVRGNFGGYPRRNTRWLHGPRDLYTAMSPPEHVRKFVANGRLPAGPAMRWRGHEGLLSVENCQLTLRTSTSPPAYKSPEAVSPVPATLGRLGRSCEGLIRVDGRPS